MAHTVCSPCVGTHDTACMKVCPVNCFYDVQLSELGLDEPADAASNEELKKMLIINPDECIDCGLCVPECPVSAIFPNDEVPEEEQKYIEINANWFQGKEGEALDAARITP
ncbi:MAG: ferredoxin family protein [Planctomycetota bacterium]|nr:ferredoxin family protein [Planctomycetota bacterium]